MHGFRSAIIDGREFLGDYARSVAKEGYFLDPDGVQGWLGGGTWRREEVPWPTGFGAVNTPAQLPQLVIPLSGLILAEHPLDLPHLIAGLTGILGDGKSHRMQVTDLDGTTFRDVGIAISPKPREIDDRTASFTMSVWAADPRAYGETNRFFNGEPMFHYGNCEAAPMLAVTATSTMGGYTIHGPDSKQYVVSQTLPAGQTHTIDMRTGQLSLNGALQLGAVSRADVWTIPPGRQVLQTLTPVSGVGALSGTVLDTFI